MPNTQPRRLDHGPELAAEFGWIVGPVLAAEVWDSKCIALVYQGPRAYAVVNPSARDYLACCPTERLARAFIDRLL